MVMSHSYDSFFLPEAKGIQQPPLCRETPWNWSPVEPPESAHPVEQTWDPRPTERHGGSGEWWELASSYVNIWWLPARQVPPVIFLKFVWDFPFSINHPSVFGIPPFSELETQWKPQRKHAIFRQASQLNMVPQLFQLAKLVYFTRFTMFYGKYVCVCVYMYIYIYIHSDR